jgi:SAM-dependent methyltransferase
MLSNTYSPMWQRLFLSHPNEDITRLEVGFLARQLPLPTFGRVLDLCCGYGRHAIGLAGLGYDVTGLDRDADAIAEANRQTLAAGEHVAYIVGDMRNVGEIAGEFDAVVNMWASLSYFDEATNLAVLRAIGAKLAMGGRFITDLYHRGYFERHQGQNRQEIDGVAIESNGYLEGDRWHSVLTYRDGQGEVCGSDHMEWQVFTPEEFAAVAATCGLAPVLSCTWADESRLPSPDIARFQIVLERR